MIYYTSTPGGSRLREELRRSGVHFMASPCHRVDPVQPYAIDSGAWHYYQRGRPFDHDLYLEYLRRWTADAEWLVLPDKVAGGLESLRMSLDYLGVGAGLLELIVLQDGMSPQDVMPYLDPGRVGLFLGGSTGWKLETMLTWGELAQDVGCYYHVGRVNTLRRLSRARAARASSVDGTCLLRNPGWLSRLLQHQTEEIQCALL